MSKPRVNPEDKRIVISARVTPVEKQTLIEVGEGNISRGIDRIITSWETLTAGRPAAAASPLAPSR